MSTQISWEKLNEVRTGMFSHPESQRLIDEAKNHYFGGTPNGTMDSFATWLCHDQNWGIFVGKFEAKTHLPLSAEYKNSPTTVVVAQPPPPLYKNLSQTPSAGKPVLEPGTLPWNRPAPKWAPSRLFHNVSESSLAEVFARGYDILSNIIGLPIFAAQMGMGTLNIAHWAVFIVGSVVISFIEVLALRALSQAVSLSSKAPPEADGYINTVQRFAVFIYGAFFLVGMLLWVVDLYLSILPWVSLFNGTAVGWVMGIVLSLLVEYIEMDAHIKTFKTMQAAK